MSLLYPLIHSGGRGRRRTLLVLWIAVTAVVVLDRGLIVVVLFSPPPAIVQLVTVTVVQSRLSLASFLLRSHACGNGGCRCGDGCCGRCLSCESPDDLFSLGHDHIHRLFQAQLDPDLVVTDLTLVHCQRYGLLPRGSCRLGFDRGGSGLGKGDTFTATDYRG